jgi:molecular chaperone GrpE
MTDPTASQAETVTEAESDTAPEVTDVAAEARREAAELKDRLLRTLADMENLRKRTEREVIDARLYGIAGFARDVLAVADNMHRALEAIGPELREDSDPKVKALIEGVELTERELLKTLEKNGIKKFSPHGEKFDPNVHQAMYEVPTSDQPPGQVAQVIQAG